MDREGRRLQSLPENLPTEQRAIAIDLINAAAKEICVELLELQHFAQVACYRRCLGTAGIHGRSVALTRIQAGTENEPYLAINVRHMCSAL